MAKRYKRTNDYNLGALIKYLKSVCCPECEYYIKGDCYCSENYKDLYCMVRANLD